MYEELDPTNSGFGNESRDGLRKVLEDELKLDSNDIRSYAWFHGRLPRDVAIGMVQDNGDFLIRESMSIPGEFVLTVMWDNAVLHFKINQSWKAIGGISKLQFQFERELFDSIPAMIMFHYGKSIPISVSTGAVIKCPVTRKVPLSYSNAKYASLKRTPSALHRAVQQDSVDHEQPAAANSVIATADSVPPKPSRVPSFRKPVIRHLTRSSKKSSKSSTLPENGVVGSVPHPADRKMPVSEEDGSSEKLTGATSNEQLRGQSSSQNQHASTERPYSVQQEPQVSSFEIEDFKSLLLPNNNKPVESGVITEIKKFLLKTDPFKLARHITYVDCKVCKLQGDGLQDILLLKGAFLRKKLIERHQCMAFWVAVCLLHGCVSPTERADLLNVFIQVANELVHSLGNVFGFSSLMYGLTCPQLSSLNDMWSYLQQKHTNNAVTMEKKLRPLLQLLDEGKGQISLTTSCIPHIMPIIRLFENPTREIQRVHDPDALPRHRATAGGGAEKNDVSKSSQHEEWWKNLPDQSFDGLLAQLKSSRLTLSTVDDLRKNADMKLHDFTPVPELQEIFSTEFHLRLLWGYKGVAYPQLERFEKFDKVITLMAKRLAL